LEDLAAYPAVMQSRPRGGKLHNHPNNLPSLFFSTKFSYN